MARKGGNGVATGAISAARVVPGMGGSGIGARATALLPIRAAWTTGAVSGWRSIAARIEQNGLRIALLDYKKLVWNAGNAKKSQPMRKARAGGPQSG